MRPRKAIARARPDRPRPAVGAGKRAVALLLAGLAALARPAAGASAGIDAIPVCYDFGCKAKQVVAITETEWREVAGWFRPAARTPEEERRRIRQAVGWMEVIVGRYTPTHRDTGFSLERGGEFPGQLDCIDESINTTTYIGLFERNGLLAHHRVLERAYRRAIFNQHWAAQIVETATGKRYVVDSWFRENGVLPYVQTLDAWLDIPFFFSFRIDDPDEYEDAGPPRRGLRRDPRDEPARRKRE